VTRPATKHPEKTTPAQPPQHVTHKPERDHTHSKNDKTHDGSKKPSHLEHDTHQVEEITFSSSSEEYENESEPRYPEVTSFEEYENEPRHPEVASSLWPSSSSSDEDEQTSDLSETWPAFNQPQSNLNLLLINRVLSEALGMGFNNGARYNLKCARCALRRAKSASGCGAKKICYGCKA